MVMIKGKGSFSGRNLVATVYEDAKTEKGGAFAQVQLDARDEHAPGNTTLNLTSKLKEYNGEKRYDNGAHYSKDQIDKIVEAAGDNKYEGKTPQGKAFTSYGIKADLMKANDGSGLIVNTKRPLEASEFAVDGETFDRQVKSVQEARASRAAAKEEKAPEASKEAGASQEVEVEQEEPEVG